jgi:hypothetical protein
MALRNLEICPPDKSGGNSKMKLNRKAALAHSYKIITTKNGFSQIIMK